jgi:hypothetical protein
MNGIVRTTALVALNRSALVWIVPASGRSISACDQNERKKGHSKDGRVLYHLASKSQKRLLPRDTCSQCRRRLRPDPLGKLTG